MFQENVGDYHRLKALMDRMQTLLLAPTTFVLFSCIWLRYIPPFSTAFWQIGEAFRCTFSYIEDQIKQRRMLQKAKQEAGEEFSTENYIDLFLNEIAAVEATDDPNSADKGAFKYNLQDPC